jgi:hypothetical protein
MARFSRNVHFYPGILLAGARAPIGVPETGS